MIKENNIHKFFIKLFLILSFLVFIPFFSFANENPMKRIKEAGALRVGLQSGYMPFVMIDRNGEYVGFDIDILKELTNSMGLKLVIVEVKNAEYIPALLENKVDLLAGIDISQDYNLDILFTNPIINIAEAILFNDKYKDDIKHYTDLNNTKYKIATITGTTNVGTLTTYFPNAKHIFYGTEKEAIQKLLIGEVDAFAYDFPYCYVMLQKFGKNKLRLLEFNTYFSYEPFAMKMDIFLNKRSSKSYFTYSPMAWGIRYEDHLFLNFLNNFLDQIKNDGRYQKIYEKWFSDQKWIETVVF